MADRTPVLGEAAAFSDYAAVVGARAMLGVLALGSVAFTTRLLTPSEFGGLSLFFVVSLLTVTAASAWTSAAVSRFGREELELTGSMVGITSARAVFVVPAFLVAVPVVLVLQTTGVLPAAFTRSLALLSVGYAAVWILFDHVVYMLETWGRQKVSAIAVLIQQVAYVGAIATLYAAHIQVGPVDVALIALTGMAVLVLVIGLMVGRVAFAARRPARMLVRRVWTYSRPLIAFVASQYVMRSVDVLVIGTFSTAAAVGAYALAYQGYGVIQQLATTAGPVFTPLLVSLRMAQRDSAIRVYVERLVPKLAFIASAVAAVAMAPVFRLVPELLGPGFGQTRLPLALLFSAGVVFLMASLLSPVITVFDRTGATAALNLAAAVVNAALDLILIGALGAGIWAAAVATIASVAIIWIGYAIVAADCLGTEGRPSLVPLVPLAGATVPLVALHGDIAIVASTGAALATSLAAFIYGALFNRRDIGLLDALDMPESLRRWTIRLLTLTRP